MKVDPGRLGEIVGEDRPDLVALDDRQARPRPDTVVAERLDRVLQRIDPVLDLVDRQLEDLRVPLDPGIERLVAEGQRRGLAIEEPLDDGGRIGIVIHRLRRRGRRCMRGAVAGSPDAAAEPPGLATAAAGGRERPCRRRCGRAGGQGCRGDAATGEGSGAEEASARQGGGGAAVGGLVGGGRAHVHAADNRSRVALPGRGRTARRGGPEVPTRKRGHPYHRRTTGQQMPDVM